MRNVSLKNTSYYLLILLATFPVIPKVAESILMILFFLFSVIIFFKKRIKKTLNLKSIFLLSSIFVIYCLGFFFADNQQENFEFIIRVAPILLFPLSLGFLNINLITEARLKILKIVYVSAVLTSLLITHFYLKFNIQPTATQWEYRNAFEDFTNVHGTYFSLWIGLALFIVVHDFFLKFFKARQYYKSIAILIVIAYFIYWQIVIEARLPLFATLLLLTISITRTFNLRTQILTFSLGILTVLFISYISFNTILEKVTFNLPEGKYALNHKTITSEHLRIAIYKCSLSLIKESWFYGYGVGDVNNALDLCYKSNYKSDVFQTFHYNSHNQYLQILLSGGIIGLLYFLLNLFLLLKKSVKEKNSIFILFNFLLCICFFTENVLSRHDGVIFFSFFSAIFFFNNKLKI